jgi:hypothetical protein
VTDPGIRSLLEKCASSPSYYFDAGNSDQLTQAFLSIAMSLRNLSLSK